MKKLLIITQKVDRNDDVLGFFHEWIRKFSERFSKVTVVCLLEGSHSLPSNVQVLSMGKESGRSKVKYLFNFYKYIIQERNNYDSVFVHMNPRYVLLGGPFWRVWHKKIVLWYAHGHVNNTLKVADKITDIALASTPEGYRLHSEKLITVGQGIDVDKFKPNDRDVRIDRSDRDEQSNNSNNSNGPFKIVSAGRLSMSKDYATLVRAVKELKDMGIANLIIEIAGQPATNKDIEYVHNLNELIKAENLVDMIKLVGPIANKDLPLFLQSADLFVNMSHTGSLDKANLEAMACGLPVVTCNEAFERVLGDYRKILMYPKKDHASLADRIRQIKGLSSDQKNKISHDMREIIVRDHNLNNFISMVSSMLSV